MWYSKIIVAAIEDVVENLRSKGVDEDTLIRLQNMTDLAKRGKYIGSLMSNPNQTFQDVEDSFKSRQEYKPSPYEYNVAYEYKDMPVYQNWVLKAFKNARIKVDPQTNEAEWDFKRIGFDSNNLERFVNALQEISHFYQATVRDLPNYNIGAKSFSDVYDDSIEWHDMMANRGSGKFYTPFERDEDGNIDDERLVMTYDDGSFMVEVNNRNDLDVEGHLMKHCVGSYANQVMHGNTKIYSLRNRFNHPEVTIEVTDNRVKQIKGPANSRVEDEDQIEKIKKFFQSSDDIETKAGKGPAHREAEYWRDHGTDWSYYPDNLNYSISDSIYGPYIDESGYGYDDEGDFSEFGIEPADFDHNEFQEENLENANLIDITNEAIDQIKTGLRLRNTIEDYNMEIYADTIAEAALNKFLNELNSQEKYLDKLPENFPTNNVIYDLFEKFGEVYEGYLNYVFDDIVLDEPELDALRNMKREPEGLWLYIVQAFLEKYPEDKAFQKFKELYKRDFILPVKYYGGEGVAYLPDMRLLGMLDPKSSGQMSFQDIPEGESFNFARYKAKMLKI